MTKKEWTIRDIEAMTREEAASMAIETMEIKKHDVFFIDFEGYFKYSAVVFYEDHHIYFANDYELHHNGRSREWLRDWYIKTLNNKLFTEEELTYITDYDDQTRKEYFIRNYYPQRVDYVSAFRICTTKAEENAFKKDIKGLHYNPVTFGYFKDETFVKKCCGLMAGLNEAKKKMQDGNFDYWKDAFVKEMYNHEYSINWQADFDVLSTFGYLEWCRTENDLEYYFKQLNFGEVQRKAYAAARKEYYNNCSY